MSKLIRLLKSPKEKDLQRDEEIQVNCSKCNKRLATDKDGLCNQCRFDDILTEMADRKQKSNTP